MDFWYGVSRQGDAVLDFLALRNLLSRIGVQFVTIRSLCRFFSLRSLRNPPVFVL